MQNTGSEKPIRIDENNREMIIKLPNTTIEMMSILGTATLTMLETIKEQVGQNIAEGCAFAVCRLILDEYEGAYETLFQDRAVSSPDLN